MTIDAPAVVVLDALAAPADPELDRVVGPGAAQRLRRELRAIARRWAAAVAPGRAFEATTPAAALIALEGHSGPVILVAPDIPSLGPEHARATLDDLESGIGLVVGSAHDAQPYLVATGTCDATLIAAAGADFEELMALARGRGLTLAMIRHERRLANAADARALALDPLAPAALVAELGYLSALRRDEIAWAAREEYNPGMSDWMEKRREARRSVEEAGGGEAEGFEQSEQELIERAENWEGRSPEHDAFPAEERGDAEYGEADHERTSEDDGSDETGS